MSFKSIKMGELAKELGAFTEGHLSNLKKATSVGVAESIPHLVKNSPVDTGLYAQSWAFTESEYSVIVGNFSPHSAIIEDGARPFTPPIGPLLAWAKRVLKDPSQPPEYSSEVWSLAKGTQKKIALVGMEPKHVMQNQIPLIIERIKKEYQKIG